MDTVIHKDSILKALQNAFPEKTGLISITNFKLENLLSTPEVNTCSDVVPVSVDYSYDGKSFKKRIIFKIPFTHPRYDFIRPIGHYDKELDMYENILPRFNQLLGSRLSPEHYLSGERQVLVLEDLTDSGYQKIQGQCNFEQAALVFKILARFHAASYKLHQEDPTSLGTASTETLFRSDVFQQMSAKQFSLFEGLVRRLSVDQATLVKLMFWKERLMSSNPFLAPGETYSLQVLNHGDSKLSNMLFQFDEDKPISVKLIDFQNCRWSSPLYDFFHFGNQSIDSSVWEKQSVSLRDAYLEELNFWLTKLGCDRQYTIEDCNHDEKLLKPFRIVELLWQLYIAAKPLLNFSTFENQNYDDEVIEKLWQDNAFKMKCFSAVNQCKKNGLL